VHCDGGINRAPTIVVGYLVSREQWSLKEAYQHIIKVRPCVAPRESYIEQLRNLEYATHGEDSLNGVSVETQELKKTEREAILRRYRENVI